MEAHLKLGKLNLKKNLINILKQDLLDAAFNKSQLSKLNDQSKQVHHTGLNNSSGGSFFSSLFSPQPIKVNLRKNDLTSESKRILQNLNNEGNDDDNLLEEY